MVVALVINLDRSPQKFQIVSERLRAAGVNDVQRVPAIDASVLSRSDIARLATKPCAVFCPREAIAISASHTAAWKRVAESNAKYAMIFEDDVVVVDDFSRKVRAVLEKIPKDFDVLLLGCFGLCDPDRKGFARLFAPGYMKNSLRYDSPHAFAPELFAGTHAYIVSKKGCAKLLERIPRARFHIDWTIASEHAHIDIYAARPPLAFQETMDDSETATCRGFPGSLSSALWTVRDAGGVPLGYYADVRFLRLGTDALVLSPWHVVLFIAGAVLRLANVPWYVLAVLSGADIALFCPGDIVSRLLFFSLGWGVAHYSLGK